MAAMHVADEFPTIRVAIENRIGSGNFSEVFRATMDHSEVAVKVFRPGARFSSQPRLTEALKEWEKLRTIGPHPHVCQCFGMARTQFHDYCLVMELMDGTLHSRFNSSDNDSDFIVYLRDVAAGLSFLHRRGLIHRDLWPGNVLWKAPGIVKIGDVGVARLISGDSDLHNATNLPGSILYMPIEACQSNPDYGKSLDVFSFGVLALAALTRGEPRLTIGAPRYRAGVRDDVHGRFLDSQKRIPETERRRQDFNLLSQNHPLRSLIIHCLDLEKKNRPRASEVCRIIESYLESSQGKVRGFDRLHNRHRHHRHRW